MACGEEDDGTEMDVWTWMTLPPEEEDLSVLSLDDVEDVPRIETR
jgi:hypothetical protein